MSVLLKNTQYVNNLLSKLKGFSQLDKDSDLATKLGISSSRLANWRRRGSVDYEVIIAYCIQEKIDMNSVFCDDHIKVITKKQDAVLLTQISKELERLLDMNNKTLVSEISETLTK